MSESLGSAVLELRADGTMLTSQVAAAKSKTIAQMRATGAASALAMAAGMVAVGAAVGVGLYKVAEQFDEAYDEIQTKTGATGKELEKLKGNFRNVFKDVPDDAKTVGSALGDVNARLGLTGSQLEARTKQFLNLSRITGTDVTSNIEAVSKAFKDWAVPVKDQEKTLDGFFRISQMTGVSVSDLATNIQRFGSPLRQLGFNVGEAASMFGSFQQAGVNTQTLMPGLKMALKNVIAPTDELRASMKQMGVDMSTPETALKSFIAKVSEARNPLKYMEEGIALFGTRAGPDMIEAMSQGRFELGKTMKAFEDGSSTINGTAEDTADLSEKMNILKNRGMIALEGPAMALFDGLTKLADGVIWLTDKWQGMDPGMKKVIKTAALFATGLIGLVYAVSKVKAAFTALTLLMSANPYVLLIAATVGIVVLIVKNWDKIKAFLAATWKWIKTAATNTFNFLLDFFKQHWDEMLMVFTGPMGILTGLVIKNWGAIKDFTTGIIESMVDWIVNALGDLKDWFVTYFKLVFKVWSTPYVKLFEFQKMILGKIRDVIVKILSSARDRVGDIARGIRTILTNVWSAIRSLTGTWWTGIKDKIVTPMSNARDTVFRIVGAIKSWVSDRWGEMRERAATAWGNIRDAITDPIKTAYETVTGKLGDLKKWVGDLWPKIVSGVSKFGTDVKNAIVSAFRGAVSAVAGFVNQILNVVDKIPGVDVGRISTQSSSKAGSPTARSGFGTQSLKGGLSGAFDTWKDLVSSATGLLGNGASALLGSLPNPSDALPSWLRGMGSWVIGEVSDWIKTAAANALKDLIGSRPKPAGTGYRPGSKLQRSMPNLRMPTLSSGYRSSGIGATAAGAPAPVVNVRFADGMGWLKNFMQVEIESADKAAEQVYIAGVAQ